MKSLAGTKTPMETRKERRFMIACSDSALMGGTLDVSSIERLRNAFQAGLLGCTARHLVVWFPQSVAKKISA